MKRLSILLLACVLSGMSLRLLAQPISQLPAASALSDSNKFPIVQGTTTVGATMSQVKTYIGATGATPGGSPNQLQYNLGGTALGGISNLSGGILIGQASGIPIFYVPSGDCSISVSGVITCTKTNGTAFAAIATTGSFADVGSGTNTNTVTMGTGGSLDFTGTGTIHASSALAMDSTPTGCSAGEFVTGFSNASLALNCSTPAGSGNVSNFGTPTAGQAAEWTDSTHVQGVAVTGSGSYMKATGPTFTLPGYATSGLPTCNSSSKGQPAYTTDGTPAFTFCNGTSWISSGGTQFTYVATGCTPSAAVGSATAGKITLTAVPGPCTSIVITPNGAVGMTAPNGWDCDVSDQTTQAAGTWIQRWGQSASTTTTATIPIPAAAGATDVITFHCVQY